MSHSRTPVVCIADCACTLGEAPLWLAAAQSLYWLDIGLSSTLFEWKSATRATRSWPLHEIATGLALSDSPELVVVSESGLNAFDTAKGAMRLVREPPFPMQGMRFNDCGCDPQGRLWTGTMVNDLRPGNSHGKRVGELYRFDGISSCEMMEDGVGCPNTFAWPADHRTLLTADSATGIIYGYDFDRASGAISHRRTFANPQNLGIPDGSAMDAEGFLWNARWGASCLARFAPDGTLAETVPIPAENVTSCIFGGPDLDTLYVTTARQKLAGAALERQPFAGGVFSFKPGVRGLAASAFRWNGLSRNGLEP